MPRQGKEKKKKQVSLKTYLQKTPKLKYKEKSDEKDNKEVEPKMVVWGDTEFPSSCGQIKFTIMYGSLISKNDWNTRLTALHNEE